MNFGLGGGLGGGNVAQQRGVFDALPEGDNYVQSLHMLCQSLYVQLNKAADNVQESGELVTQFLNSLQQQNGGLFGAGKVYLDKRVHSSQLYVQLWKLYFHVVCFVLHVWGVSSGFNAKLSDLTALKTFTEQQLTAADSSRTPQKALRFLWRSYAVILAAILPETPLNGQKSLDDYASVSCLNAQLSLSHAQLFRGGSSAKDEIQFEFLFKIPLLDFEAVWSRFQQNFNTQRQAYHRHQQIVKDGQNGLNIQALDGLTNQTNAWNATPLQQQYDTPFGTFYDEYHLPDNASLSNADWARVTRQIEHMVMQSRFGAAERYKGTDFMSGVYKREQLPQKLQISEMDGNVRLTYEFAVKVQVLCALMQQWNECWLLSWEDSQTSQFVQHRLYGRLRGVLRGLVQGIVDSALADAARVRHNDGAAAAAFEALAGAFVRPEASRAQNEAQTLKKAILGLIGRLQLLSSAGLALLAAGAAVDFTPDVRQKLTQTALHSWPVSLHNSLDLLLYQHTLLSFNTNSVNQIVQNEMEIGVGLDVGVVSGIINEVLSGPADVVSAAIVECGRSVERQVRSGVGPQSLCVALLERGKPSDVLDQIVAAISGDLYADSLVEVRGMGAADPAQKVAFQSDQSQFLAAGIQVLENYASKVVDAGVRELFIQKVVLVLDYASFQVVQGQNTTSTTSGSLFGGGGGFGGGFGGFGGSSAQNQAQNTSINVKTLVVPAWCLLLELFNALSAPEELLEGLCRICARIKLIDAESFFKSLGDYAQIFDKFTALIVVNKQSAGALLNLFKGDPRLLLNPGMIPSKNVAKFYGYLKQTLLYDLKSIDALYANKNYFYIQKLYDFLTSYIERDNNNAIIYHIINSSTGGENETSTYKPEQLNYLQLKAFMNNLSTLESPLTQKAALQYLGAHLSREVSVSGVEKEVYSRLYDANGRGMAELLVQLHSEAIPVFFSWAATIASRKSGNTKKPGVGSGADLVLLVSSTARQLKQLLDTREIAINTFYDTYGQFIQALDASKTLAKMGERIDSGLIDGCLQGILFLHTQIDCVLVAMQLLQLKLLTFFNSGSDIDVLMIQNIPHMLQTLENAAANVQNYLSAGGNIENISSFETYNSTCLLILTVQISLLGDSDEMQLRLKHRLGFLLGPQGVVGVTKGPLYLLASSLKLLDESQGRRYGVQQRNRLAITTENLISELTTLLNSKDSNKDDIHTFSRRLSQCLRLKASGDQQAQEFFVSNTTLLSLASQVAAKLYGQKSFNWQSVEGLLVQKLVLFIYLNLKATTEVNQHVKVQASHVRQCVQLQPKLLEDLKGGNNAEEVVQSASGALYNVLVK